MAAPARQRTSRTRTARPQERRRPGTRRDGLRGSMSSDPKVVSGERDRDAIPHTGREGFGEGQELSHAKRRRR